MANKYSQYVKDQIGFRAPPELHAKLERISAATGATRAQVLRCALEVVEVEDVPKGSKKRPQKLWVRGGDGAQVSQATNAAPTAI